VTPLLNVNGRRFHCDGLSVGLHRLDDIPFSAVDPLRDEVVHTEVRKGLEDPLRIELAVTEHCLDWNVFLRSPHQPSNHTMNLIGRVLVPR
jgi:hypothetical protein